MGGGCSTKRSIAVNDADAKVELKKNVEESKGNESSNHVDQLNFKNKSKLHVHSYGIEFNKEDEKKIGKLMRKQLDADDFEESVEDLNDFGKQTGVKSDKE